MIVAALCAADRSWERPCGPAHAAPNCKPMADKHTIRVNRAPVLTLWAAVVAERLSFDREAALTLGRAVAGTSAQMKGRALGIYEPTEEPPSKAAEERRKQLKPDDAFGVRLLRPVFKRA